VVPNVVLVVVAVVVKDVELDVEVVKTDVVLVVVLDV
jgi:hypothetical protein